MIVGSIRHERLWFILVVLSLALSLAAGATLLVRAQHKDFMMLAQRDGEEALAFLAHIARSELDRGHYDHIPELLQRWAIRRPDIYSVRLVAQNGFNLGNYPEDVVGDRPTQHFVVQTQISYSYDGEATLEIIGDLSAVFSRTNKLAIVSAIATTLLTLLFGSLLRIALNRKREAAIVQKRSAELVSSNRQLASTIVELERAEAENKRLAVFPRENPDPIVAFNRSDEAVFENPAIVRLTAEFRAPELANILPRNHNALLHKAREHGTRVRTDYVIQGRYFNAQYQHSGFTDEVFVYLSEHTAQRQAEQRLRQEQSKAQVTLASIGDAVMTTDSLGCIEYMNPTAERLCGIDNNAAIGQQLADILTLIREDSDEPLGNIASVCARRKVALNMQDRISLIRHNGSRIPIQATAAPIRSETEAVRGVVVVLRDVSRERALQVELTQQATHDSLTGLLNRNAFETHLSQALDSARSRKREHALCFIDLDQFKVVNDTCGHVAGDELLRQFGLLMRRHFREGDDVIARLGGDEFAVLLHDCPMPQAVLRAEKLRAEVAEQSFSWDGQVFRPGVSIGITPINPDSKDIGQILSAADAACYEAKDLGRNRVNLYNPGDRKSAERHSEMHWVSRINTALANDQFTLFGQPIVDLSDELGSVWGIEVLVRMTDSDGALVPPGAFLPAAERFNLIERVDNWVIENALAILQSANHPPTRLFLNISGPTLNQEGFLAFLTNALERHPVDPGALVFEVTETAAIRNLASALKLIGELKLLGAKFALDDFGTGVSSFAYLKNLPVNYLKIDGTFVRDLDQDPLDLALVEAIHKVGTTLGLETIAEFIETPAILAEVRNLGITRGQGFGVAPTRPLRELLNTPR